MKSTKRQARRTAVSLQTFAPLPLLLALMLAPGLAHGQAEEAVTAEKKQVPQPARPTPTPLEQLKSPASDERYIAALAPGKSGDRAAILPLMEVLASDPNPSVRSAAAWSLGALSARVAIPNLRHAADNDEAPAVRMAAQKALLKMGVAPERREEVVQLRVVHPAPMVRPAPVVDPLQEFYNSDAYNSGRRMRTAGIVFTVVGGTVGGLIGAVGLDAMGDQTPGSNREENAKTIAVGGFVAGGVCLLIGVPLWAGGQSKINKAWNERQEGAMVPEVKLALTREYQGMTAQWSF